MLEFGIAHDPVETDGGWYVIGRCVTDICQGGKFTKFIPHRKVQVPGSEEFEFVCDVALPINLTIVKIWAYGKVHNEWSAGMTAGLTLYGDGKNLGSYGSLSGD